MKLKRVFLAVDAPLLELVPGQERDMPGGGQSFSQPNIGWWKGGAHGRPRSVSGDVLRAAQPGTGAQTAQHTELTRTRRDRQLPPR